MNVFNFLTALVVSGAFVACIAILAYKPLNIRIIHHYEEPTHTTSEQQGVSKEEYNAALQKELNADNNKASTMKEMDAVIKSVNELMGVRTPDESSGDK